MNNSYDNGLESIINTFSENEERIVKDKILYSCATQCFDNFDKHELSVKEDNCLKSCYFNSIENLNIFNLK